VPTRDLILELLEFIDDVVDEFGMRKEIEHIHTILERAPQRRNKLASSKKRRSKAVSIV